MRIFLQYAPFFRSAVSAARVSNTTTEEYFANAQVFAPRPTNSALDLSKLIAAGFTPRDHRDALAEYLCTL